MEEIRSLARKMIEQMSSDGRSALSPRPKVRRKTAIVSPQRIGDTARGESPGPAAGFSRVALLGLAVLLALVLLRGTILRHSSRPRPAALTGSELRPPEEEALRRDVAGRPGDAEAHRRLGGYYLAHARPFEAIWELLETRAQRPDEMDVRPLLAAALEAAQLPDPARELLEERVASPAGELERRLALARHHLHYGDADAAGQVLRGAGGRLSAEPAGLLVQGRVLQAEGDRAAAEAAYRRHLRLAPASAEGDYRLGRLLLEAGRAGDARAALTAGRRAAPEDARFPFYLGLTYAPGIDSDRQAGLSPQAAARARALFQEAVRLAPNNALPQFELGLLDAQAGRWGAAADRFRAATQADASDASAYRELARALGALKKHPYDAYYRGLYYAKVERPEDAVRAFRTVAQARPDSAEGPLLVSRMYIQTMQYAEAAAAVEPALRRFPHDGAVYERLAVLYKVNGSHAVVERLCRQWRAALPQASEPYWVLAELRTADGRVEEGIRLYEQALAMEPARAEYMRFLGQTLAQRGAPGDLPRALDLLGRAVRKAPRDPAARFQLGLLLRRMGRMEEARDQMLRALDLDPHQVPPYNSLAQIAGQLRHPAQARFFAMSVRGVEARLREESEVMRRVWRHPRDAGAHLAAARFRQRIGDLTTAKAHLEQAVELRPGWPDATRALRRISRALEVL
jgi:tetratricopeptide (TPR) repeat protein